MRPGFPNVKLFDGDHAYSLAVVDFIDVIGNRIEATMTKKEMML